MPVPSTAGGLSTRTRSVAFCGLTVALLVVSAWISVPIGPVPITLQSFVLVFALLVLGPKECLASIVVYIALGAVGLPVFSSMRGGIGVVLGPTGGFLWGFVLGACLVLLFLKLVGYRAASRQEGEGGRERSKGRGSWFTRRSIVVSFAAGLIFIVVYDLCGWIQLMAVSHLDPWSAFLAGVAPFLVLDIVKLFAAVVTAQAVNRALK